MRTSTAVLGWFLLLVFLSPCGMSAEPAATTAAQTTPAALIELGIDGRQKVFEVSGQIEMRYALTVASDQTAGIVKSSAPLGWKITDASGKVVLEVAPGKADSPAALDGHSVATSGIYGEQNIKPAEKWPEGVLRVEATYSATREMYAALGAVPADAFVGAISSKPVEIIVKPDGWKEQTYKRYAAALERMLKSKLRPLAFEFPEARNLENVTVVTLPEGAVGRFKLEREYLEILKEQKTARLRKAEGFLEFAARDPWAKPDVPPDVKGPVEDGLVSVEFRYNMATNKWLAGRLPIIEAEILKDLQAKGYVAAESYVVPPHEVMPSPTMPSTEDMLRTPQPEIPRE